MLLSCSIVEFIAEVRGFQSVLAFLAVEQTYTFNITLALSQFLSLLGLPRILLTGILVLAAVLAIEYSVLGDGV